MFSNNRRKRMRDRIVFASIGIFLLAFGIWLNIDEKKDEEPAKDALNKVEAFTEESSSNEIEIKDDADNTDNTEKTGTMETPETYLIKEVNGVVKVFLCDGDGDKELYLITSIPFDLLSENDQQLFIDGVYVETEEDLGEFLENFDS